MHAVPIPRHRLLGRVMAFGCDNPSPIGSGKAIERARSTTAHDPKHMLPGLRFGPGDRATHAATGCGRDRAAGARVGSRKAAVLNKVTLGPSGTVHVRFPRIGFQFKLEKA
jgi:hypothetical protein